MDREYRIVHLASGLICVVVAKNYIQALQKGRRYFSGPNSIARVQVIN